MTENAISQMQMLYVPEEDRILFRVNSTNKQQFRLWLTRRYSLLFLQILKKHRDSDPDISIQATPEAKQAVQSFKQEQAVQNANFEQSFAEEAEQLPLGDQIPLAFRLNYRLEGEVMHLGIEPSKGQGINLVINLDINSSLTQLITAAANKAAWNLVVSETPVNRGSQQVVN